MKAQSMMFAAVASSLLSATCTIDSTSVREPATITPSPTPYIPEVVPETRRFVILHTNDEHSHLLGFGPESLYPYQPVIVGDAGVCVGGAQVGAACLADGDCPASSCKPDGRPDSGTAPDYDASTVASWAVDPSATAAQITANLSSRIDQYTKGGIVRRQYLINKARAGAAATNTPVLLLSAGDVMMGSLFHAAYAQGQAPDYLAMTFLGYDFIALGNHEFDFGVPVLASAIAAAQSSTFGGAPTILASNIHFDDGGAELQALYGGGNSGAPIQAWATKRLANGLKIGFMAVVGYSAALVAPGKSPIAFSTPTDGGDCIVGSCPTDPLISWTCVRGRCVDPLDLDGHLKALYADTKRVVDTLKIIEKVDVVVVLSHSGYTEDKLLAANTSGIDVIVGGHSHDRIAPEKVNGVILTQAGSYGEILGKLTITVDPEGKVDVDTAESSLIDVSSSTDAQMLADAGQGSLKTAIAFTVGLLGPLVGGLNAALLAPAPSTGIATGLVNGVLQAPTPITSIVGPIGGIVSDHDVMGEVDKADSYLTHLVTDAELERVFNHKCEVGLTDPSHTPVVAVQANGVLRESLRFNPITTDRKTSLDDIFRVLPLGASPFEGTYAAPGYTLLKFKLNAAEMLAGLDVGVTKGLDDNDFFLSYAGMRTEYDRSRSPFNPAHAMDGTTGRITKIELMDQHAGLSSIYYPVALYDVSRPAGSLWKDPVTAGNPDIADPTAYFVTVITNLYLAGFLDAFGLAPRDDDGQLIGCTAPGDCDPAMERLAETALCFNPGLAARVVNVWPIAQTNECDDYGLASNSWLTSWLPSFVISVIGGVTAPVIQCSTLSNPPWALAPEVKEWEAIYLFLAAKGGLLTSEYAGTAVAPADLRVKDVTP
jgi:2',3'-cyclic-nucleotide 2'-phosphodiesterase (5'-nucleotidase family)